MKDHIPQQIKDYPFSIQDVIKQLKSTQWILDYTMRSLAVSIGKIDQCVKDLEMVTSTMDSGKPSAK